MGDLRAIYCRRQILDNIAVIQSLKLGVPLNPNRWSSVATYGHVKSYRARVFPRPGWSDVEMESCVCHEREIALYNLLQKTEEQINQYWLPAVEEKAGTHGATPKASQKVDTENPKHARSSSERRDSVHEGVLLNESFPPSTVPFAEQHDVGSERHSKVVEPSPSLETQVASATAQPATKATELGETPEQGLEQIPKFGELMSAAGLFDSNYKPKKPKKKRTHRSGAVPTSPASLQPAAIVPLAPEVHVSPIPGTQIKYTDSTVGSPAHDSVGETCLLASKCSDRDDQKHDGSSQKSETSQRSKKVAFPHKEGLKIDPPKDLLHEHLHEHMVERKRSEAAGMPGRREREKENESEVEDLWSSLWGRRKRRSNVTKSIDPSSSLEAPPAPSAVEEPEPPRALTVEETVAAMEVVEREVHPDRIPTTPPTRSSAKLHDDETPKAADNEGENPKVLDQTPGGRNFENYAESEIWWAQTRSPKSKKPKTSRKGSTTYAATSEWNPTEERDKRRESVGVAAIKDPSQDIRQVIEEAESEMGGNMVSDQWDLMLEAPRKARSRKRDKERKQSSASAALDPTSPIPLSELEMPSLNAETDETMYKDTVTIEAENAAVEAAIEAAVQERMSQPTSNAGLETADSQVLNQSLNFHSFAVEPPSDLTVACVQTPPASTALGETTPHSTPTSTTLQKNAPHDVRLGDMNRTQLREEISSVFSTTLLDIVQQLGSVLEKN